MLARNSTVIDPKKSKEFNEFLHKIAKDEAYWAEVRRKASTPINTAEMNRLIREDRLRDKR